MSEEFLATLQEGEVYAVRGKMFKRDFPVPVTAALKEYLEKTAFIKQTVTKGTNKTTQQIPRFSFKNYKQGQKIQLPEGQEEVLKVTDEMLNPGGAKKPEMIPTE